METEITLNQALEELAQVKRELREVKEQYAHISIEPEQSVSSAVSEAAEPNGDTIVEYPTEHPHICTNPEMHGGEPTIRGSRITVRTIIERMRVGQSPLEIFEAFPHLSLAKIYDGIAYYYDHPSEIDQYIRENEEAMWRITHRDSL